MWWCTLLVSWLTEGSITFYLIKKREIYYLEISYNKRRLWKIKKHENKVLI